MFNRILKFILNSNYRWDFFSDLELSKYIADEKFLKLRWHDVMKSKLNLTNPKTFNEKLQWLKLYDRKPLYTKLVDKFEVKEIVSETIGKQYIIPTLGVWNSFSDIDFEKLPNQFVLKCTHDSGGNVIVTDKEKLDFYLVKTKIQKCFNRNYFYRSREWPYKNVQPRIIAEQYMIDSSSSNEGLRDYKFMCFNGKVGCCFVCSDRYSKEGLHVTFFDLNWNVLPFERHYPSKKNGLPKPKCFNEMVMLAEKLSKSIPFVRVDFYEINDKVYFGELTFYPGAGFEEFTPYSADLWLGNLLLLPKVQ